MKLEPKIKRLRRAASAVGMVLLGAAIVQELRKPATDRAWHGRLWGRVPYEFRPPSIERLRNAYWAPEDRHVFTDTPFGVGWALNLGRLVRGSSGHGATLSGTAARTASMAV